MKKLITLTLPALLLIIIALEITFRTLIPASTHPFFRMFEIDSLIIGHYTQENNETGIKTIGAFARHPSRWRINNHGWNNEMDYTFEKDTNRLRIAIIGDSYVEALNVNSDESFVVRLQKYFGESTEVYSFGIGGSPFSQYLNFSRYVKKKYNPDVYIILLTNNDFDQSLIQFGTNNNLLLKLQKNNVISETKPVYHEVNQKKWLQISKKSALVRYLYYNLQIGRVLSLHKMDLNHKKIREDKTIAINTVNPKETYSSDSTIYNLSNYLLTVIKENCDKKRLIIVNDGRRNEIYKNNTDKNNFGKTVDIIKQLTDTLNIEFIDLHAAFEHDYKINSTKFNYHIDYHWNSYGHKVVADTLYQYLLINQKATN